VAGVSPANFQSWVSALDLEGRTIWIVDAHGYGKRFFVRADEKLTAFMELERAIHCFAVSLMLKNLTGVTPVPDIA
jgi:hypothetical protein